MRDFPSCFGENGVQVADSSSSTAPKAAQNLVTYVYQCKLKGHSCLITVTWTKNLMGQGLGVSIDDSANQCLCKLEIKAWLFSKRKDRGIYMIYLAIAFDQEIVLLLGDLKKEAYKKIDIRIPLDSDAVLVAKKEHIFGKKFYGAKSQFWDKGLIHDVVIECDTGDLKDPCLVIRIDSKMVMQVKKLKWKFRGNQTILVDGLPVEVLWDVHNWLFGNAAGNAVFMFRTCVGLDKSAFDPSVLTWSCSQKLRDHQLQGLSFSLMFYAWKHE
ncbi:NAC domain-containing protein 68-like [Hibiscus syriacus]|uniref:NAC domain-containing protein 68-like n=1 Tax=Hibiscus syriacus TaxID=106335 RepID=A0A6A2YRK3_HIBSY|nr:NAC domain-containing protein 68-like [Hibiscus syriacus]